PEPRLRVSVPHNTPAGVYHGTVSVSAEGFDAEVPLEVEVYDFALPDVATVKTMMGSSWHNLNHYYDFKNQAHRREVIELYTDTYASHRISPYYPIPTEDFTFEWKGDDWRTAEVVFDWTRWDAAIDRAVNEKHFNTFVINVAGLGGGNIRKRNRGNILGHELGTKEHEHLFAQWCEQVGQHLREKGLVGKAICYAFDEPKAEDLDFVVEQLDLVKKHLPEVRRMVPLHRKHVEPFVGKLDWWCPILNSHDLGFSKQRQKLGETYTWYICVSPTAPYVGSFIDRGATDLRVWLWQTWQNGVDGILIWEAMHWHSAAVYPDEPQNPYRDTMSWAPFAKTPWKAGDGRFIYPPKALFDENASRPVMDKPVASIRFEMLRDGVEDYEYLTILKDLALAHENELSADELSKIQTLLEVPAEISTSLTSWTKVPEPIEERRDAVARAIEEIRNR
ncbi:MAG: glycoside hydrolase domain-containing protein, partial [Planctomycetota bacterium]